MVLLPVFALLGLPFALLLRMAGARRQALAGGETGAARTESFE
jgi:hypothetical protein